MRKSPSGGSSGASSGRARTPIEDTEEIILVEPYTSGSRPTKSAAGTSQSLAYRERQASFQSDALSRQFSALSVPSRSVSRLPEERGDTETATGPPSRAASPPESPTNEDPPGLYTFNIPGRRSPFRLNLEADKVRTKVIVMGQQQRQRKADESNLIFKFGKFREILNELPVEESRPRRPRKVQAKKLDYFSKTPGQKTFSFNAETWLKERTERFEEP